MWDIEVSPLLGFIYRYTPDLYGLHHSVLKIGMCDTDLEEEQCAIIKNSLSFTLWLQAYYIFI